MGQIYTKYCSCTHVLSNFIYATTSADQMAQSLQQHRYLNDKIGNKNKFDKNNIKKTIIKLSVKYQEIIETKTYLVSVVAISQKLESIKYSVFSLYFLFIYSCVFFCHKLTLKMTKQIGNFKGLFLLLLNQFSMHIYNYFVTVSYFLLKQNFMSSYVSVTSPL